MKKLKFSHGPEIDEKIDFFLLFWLVELCRSRRKIFNTWFSFSRTLVIYHRMDSMGNLGIDTEIICQKWPTSLFLSEKYLFHRSSRSVFCLRLSLGRSFLELIQIITLKPKKWEKLDPLVCQMLTKFDSFAFCRWRFLITWPSMTNFFWYGGVPENPDFNKHQSKNYCLANFG